MSDVTVLVTGNLGYIGTVVAPLLRAAGHDVTGLQWALRGAQHYPDIDRFIIYAHGAHTRAWSCFAARLSCPPLWKYRLTDGLTPPIPPSARTLAIYAYDWAGNISVREVPLT